MGNQRGFAMTAMLWGYVAAGIAIAALTAGLWVQTLRLDASKAEYAHFKGGQVALATAAKIAAEKKAKEDKATKEKVDADHKLAIAALNTRISRLRKSRDGRGSGVPATPASSKCPQGLTCYDRAALERAYRELVAEVRAGADEGSAIAADLDAAKQWARDAGMK
jgi:hypothetical protein